MKFRLLTVALVAATLALVGCGSYLQDSTKSKSLTGQVIKPGETVTIDVDKLLKEQTDVRKAVRVKQCSKDIDSCELTVLLNAADEVYKRDAGMEPPPRDKQLEILQKQGYLVPAKDGNWKIHDELFKFLIAVRDQDTTEPQMDKRPQKDAAPKDK